MNKKLAYVFVPLLLIVVVFGGWKVYKYYSTHETTDDAQIEGDIVPVLSRVTGYVDHVNVSDNDKVDSGAVIAQLDTRSYTRS